MDDRYHDIVLDGFSEGNYGKLDRSVGDPVCIYGRMSIDSIHDSVYFPLQPMEEDEVITIGFSRVISGLSYDYANRNGMVDGQSYRVCGILRDATPFRQCGHNRCKWYKLEDAELQ